MLADRPLPAASDGFFAGPRLPVDPMDATIIDERLAGFDLALVFCGLGLRLSGGIECLIRVAAGEANVATARMTLSRMGAFQLIEGE